MEAQQSNGNLKFKTQKIYTNFTIHELRTLLSLSSSFLSHSKSEYLLRTLDSFTRKTGRFVCKVENSRVTVLSKYTPVASHLEPDLVVCVPLAGDAVGDRVDDVNLEKVCRGGVCVIQGLLLAARTNNRLCKDAKHMISRDDLSNRCTYNI